jgi:hypothetical protein
VIQGKNHKDRLVPIHPDLVTKCIYLKEQIHQTSPDDEFFFMIRPGREMKLFNVYHNFRRYLEKAGIPHTGRGPRVHDFRHTYCVNLLRKWIEEGKNLLITGMTSSGKTYLSNAICVAALRQFKTVRYIRANHLMLELEQARLKSTYLDYVNTMMKLDLLVIDDFGLMEFDLDKCRDFFEVVDGREGRKSTMIVSQFPVKKWFDMFKDQTYADACLARLTDKRHSYRLEMNGISMRKN